VLALWVRSYFVSDFVSLFWTSIQAPPLRFVHLQHGQIITGLGFAVLLHGEEYAESPSATIPQPTITLLDADGHATTASFTLDVWGVVLGDGSSTDELDASANGTQNLATTFAVYTPTASSGATETVPAWEYSLDGQDLAVQLLAPGGGFSLKSKVTLPAPFTTPGFWNFWQIAAPSRKYTDQNKVVHMSPATGKIGLDGLLPYPSAPSNPYNVFPAPG
jgi:hypothetical protein